MARSSDEYHRLTQSLTQDLRKIVEERGLSQPQLEEMSGLSRSSIARLMTNRGKIFSFVNLVKVYHCLRLQIDISYSPLQ